jgi:uracil-DNA glycosylase
VTLRSKSRRLDPATAHLLAEVRGCTLCSADLPLGPRPILQAHPAARVLVAGQAPGSKVHQTGVPFDDPSGDRLRAWMGIDADTFYDPTRIAILPMGFCYPGTGRSGDNPPRPECAVAWRQRLLGRLPNVELTLVIGQYAQAWHLGERCGASLTDTVKAWRSFAPRVIPLPHPSPRNNIWLKRNPWFAETLVAVKQRVRQLLDFGGLSGGAATL